MRGKMKIFVVNGVPQSGKDTFVNFCLDELTGWGKSVSTIDFVKEVAVLCGWSGKKTPKDRKFLSDLKDLLTDWGNVPYNKVLKEKQIFEYSFDGFGINPEKAFFFIFCREPKEIQKFVDGINAKTILIRREIVENIEQSNHADAGVFNFDYDIIIENNGTLKDLRDKAKKFLKEEGWNRRW